MTTRAPSDKGSACADHGDGSATVPEVLRDAATLLQAEECWHPGDPAQLIACPNPVHDAKGSDHA